MRLRSLVLLLPFLLGGAGLPAFAGEPPQAPEPARDRETPEAPTLHQTIQVTTAPELPQKIRTSAREIAERAPTDLAIALRSEPGLDASRQGPINLDPQVRALRETQLVVLVDGTRTFPAGPARMDSEMSHVDSGMVETLRVVTGPYALAWGGGLAAISVETFTPPFAGPRTGGRLTLGYGENADAANAGGLIWAGRERWRLTLLHDSRQGHDYETGSGAVIPGDYTSHTTRWGLGLQPRPGVSLDYRGGYQRQDDIDYPGRVLDATWFAHRTHSLEVSARPGGVELFGQLYSTFKDHFMDNDGKPSALPNPQRMPPFGMAIRFPTASDAVGGKTFARWSLRGMELQAGLDGYRLEQDATRSMWRRDTGALLFVDRVWSDVRIDHGGAYLQATTRRPRFSLTGTVRLDSERTSVGPVTDFFRQQTGDVDLEADETDPGASLAARWQVSDAWSLSLGAGRVVRYPTALERYADRIPSTRFQTAAEFLGRPDLKPETGSQLDLGTTWAGGGTLLDVQLFYRSVDDYVSAEPDPSLPRRLPASPPLVYRYTNGGRATWWGGELRLRGTLGDDWAWQAGLSSVRGEDETRDEPAYGVPPLLAHLGLRWQPDGPFHVDLSTRIADDQDRVSASRFEQPTPGYTLVDLRSEIRTGARWTLRAGVENLFDETWTNHLNTLDPFTGERLPEPGRSVFLGLTLEL